VLSISGSACTLSADLDRLKGDAGGPIEDAAAEEPPKLCEKGVDCTGCAACESFCQCGALPAAYDNCVKQCLDSGL
jgi:hypothetical protein